MVRTHVMLPESLVEELDATVEPRRRSAFVEAAIREKLLRERQRTSLRSTAGGLRSKPGAAWSADPSTWVRSLREQDESVRAFRSTRPALRAHAPRARA